MRGLKNAPYLKIFYYKDADSIEIIGNKPGLEDLADTCHRLISKVTNNLSCDHYHLFVGINLVNGSNETIITFDPEFTPLKQDYDPRRFELLKKKYGNKKTNKKNKL